MSGKFYLYSGILMIVLGLLIFSFVEVVLHIKKKKITKNYQ